MDWQPLAGVVVTFGLLAALVWAVRRVPERFGAGRDQARRLGRIARLELTAHHAVHLIEAEGRTLLVLTSPSGASVAPVRPPRAVAGEQEAGQAAGPGIRGRGLR